MEKVQINVRMATETADAARAAAERQHITLQLYLERLVLADTDPRRTMFLDTADNVIEEFGSFIEERASATAQR
jgi:hypothetical protein